MQIERESFPEEEFMYFFDQILWVAEDFIEVVMNEDKEYARKEHSGDRLIRNFSNSKIIKDLKDKYDDELWYMDQDGEFSIPIVGMNAELLEQQRDDPRVEFEVCCGCGLVVT